MDEPRDPFDRLPDEVFQLIFLAVSDCKSLVRCMAVSRSFREHSERVSTLSIVCPGHFTSYVEKLERIYTMVRRFHCLEVLVVRVGQPKDEPPSWARCMRYAEIGLSVEKFIFMAAKTGEFSEFDSAIRGVPLERRERKESSSEGENDFQDQSRNAEHEVGSTSSRLATGEASNSDNPSQAAENVPSSNNLPDFNLRQVVAPSNDVLKRMVPVIVFAIVQGLDDFRDSVPDFIRKFGSLKTFLLVDMLESVTVFMREHQIQQIRCSQQLAESTKEARIEEGKASAVETTEVASPEDEQLEMWRHDVPASGKGSIVDEGSSSCNDENRRGVELLDGFRQKDTEGSRKGKELVPPASEGRQKGKESESSADEEKKKGKEAESSANEGKQRRKEAESSEPESSANERKQKLLFPATEGRQVAKDEGKLKGKEVGSAGEGDGQTCTSFSGVMEDCDEDEITSAMRHGPSVRVASSEEDGRTSEDGAEGWRNCRGICIHEAADGRGDFVSKYRRNLKGRENRLMKAGGYRRREKSADWMDESGRRRQENRLYKASSFRRREESRAFKYWRLEKDEDSSSSSSSSALSFPSFSPTPEEACSTSVFRQEQATSIHPCCGLSPSSSTVPEVPENINKSSGGDVDSMASNVDHLNSSKLQLDTHKDVVWNSNDHAKSSRTNDLTTGEGTSRNAGDNLSNLNELRNDNSNNTNNEGGSMDQGLEGEEERRQFSWGRSDSEAGSGSSSSPSPRYHGFGFSFGGPLRSSTRVNQRANQREAWREAWRETWGERLGRRARELRREMQSQAAEQGIRRERLREGARRRQMEIEREALRFDITFWRADQVAVPRGGYALADVSMCIATHAATPLGGGEVDALCVSALAGPLLAATIAHVNQQAAFHNL